jgi:selenoprotein W-related protein
VSLFNELMQDKTIEAQIKTIEIVPSDGGRFEVTVNGKLVYSKMSTGRHANPGEIHQLVKAKL